VLGAGLWQRIVRVGVVIAAVTLGVALWGHATDRPWQTMAFFALGATQLAAALGSRARPGTLANPALLWSVAGALGLQFAALYLPFLNDLLKTKPLTVLDLVVVVALSTLGYAAIRLDRIVHKDHSGRNGAITPDGLVATDSGGAYAPTVRARGRHNDRHGEHRSSFVRDGSTRRLSECRP
jgi:hypothetical protein